MSFFRWLWVRRKFVSRIAESHCRPVRPWPCTFRPRLDVLEDRSLPATFTITLTDDSGDSGSLRHALSDPNLADGDVIELSVTSPIVLSAALPVIEKDIVLQTVSGVSTVTIQGTGNLAGSSVFVISAGAEVTFQALIIKGGSAEAGGGINNSGHLTLKNSLIADNHANSGGGISNSGVLFVYRSTIAGNSAETNGGAIHNTGTLTIFTSTLANNTAGEQGGAVFTAVGASTTVLSVTIAGNSALTGGGVAIEESTDGAGVLQLKNTIVANNHASDAPDITGAVTSLGHNLVGDGTGSNLVAVINGDQVGTADELINPGLGPLTLHFLTPTMALADTSSARDAGDASGLDDTVLDQHGIQRVINGPLDIGAVEWFSTQDDDGGGIGTIDAPVAPPDSSGSSVSGGSSSVSGAPGSAVTSSGGAIRTTVTGNITAATVANSLGGFDGGATRTVTFQTSTKVNLTLVARQDSEIVANRPQLSGAAQGSSGGADGQADPVVQAAAQELAQAFKDWQSILAAPPAVGPVAGEGEDQQSRNVPAQCDSLFAGTLAVFDQGFEADGLTALESIEALEPVARTSNSLEDLSGDQLDLAYENGQPVAAAALVLGWFAWRLPECDRCRRTGL